MDITAKGKLGIRIVWLAAIAFFLCILGQTLLLGLFLALVLLTEKNDWLTYQTIQAFLLCVVSALFSAFNGALAALYSIPFIGGVFSSVFGFVFGVVELAVFITAICGCVKAARGEALNIPVISKVAGAAFHAPVPEPVYTPVPQPTPQQPVYAQAAAPVQPAQAPADFPVQAPVQPDQPTEIPQ
jgi:uncharacterized membrane protein